MVVPEIAPALLRTVQCPHWMHRVALDYPKQKQEE